MRTKGKDVDSSCALPPCERSEADPSWPAVVELDDTIEFVVAQLAVGPEAVDASAAVLSNDERRRASRFVFDRDARRYSVARARLRQLLGVRLGVPPESVEFVYGAHGKPALAQRFADSGLCFNVAHCDDCAVYAFSNRRAIGVDVEAIRAIGDADVIAARFFARGENQAYRALDPRDKALGFFNCWTRKEAFIKALGEGLSHPLDWFEVSLAPSEPAKLLRVKDAPGDACGWSLDSLVPAPGYVAAIARQR